MHSSSLPRMGVIVPVYNYAEYLPTALNSVLAQSDTPCDIVVVDDGSTDNISDVLEKYRGSIISVRQSNQGLSAARNTGIKTLLKYWDKNNIQNGAVIFLDADDLLMPGTLAAHAETLQKNPFSNIAVCRNKLVTSKTPEGPFIPVPGNEEVPLDKHLLPVHFCHANMAPVHCFAVRRKLIEKTGFFDTGLSACEDHDYWLRCCVQGAQMAYSPKGLVLYRKHSDSMSGSDEKQQLHSAEIQVRISKILKQHPNFPNHFREAAWLAHISGCLCTLFSWDSKDTEGAMKMFACARMGMKELEKESMDKQYAGYDDSVHRCIQTYYSLGVMKYLNVLAEMLPSSGFINEMKDIFIKLYPDIPSQTQDIEDALKRIGEDIFMPLNSQRES